MNDNSTNAAILHSLSRTTGRVRDIAWTVAGVGMLALAGIAIHATGVAAKLPDACWQLTGARAAASTAILGTLVSLRRGNFALFGALYGAWLMTTHANGLLVGSAAAAGVAAWLAGVALIDRGVIVRLLTTTLIFNVLLTTSGLVRAIQSDAGSRTSLTNWSAGLGMRVLATVIVVGLFVLLQSKRLTRVSAQ